MLYDKDQQTKKQMLKEKYHRSTEESKERARTNAKLRLLTKKANMTEEELKEKHIKELTSRRLRKQRKK